MNPLPEQTINIPLSGNNAGRSTGGNLYGSSETAIILSNMNTNNQIEWQPLLKPLLNGGYMVLTYDYINPQADQWDVLTDVISHIKTIGAKRIVLIGASRGGVTSMQVLGKSDGIYGITGVAAISSPVEHEGTVFFTPEELGRVTIPKLFINTEHDECAAGTRQMFDMTPVPKEMVFYPGEAHGTEIFSTDIGARLIRRLIDFTSAVLE